MFFLNGIDFVCDQILCKAQLIDLASSHSQQILIQPLLILFQLHLALWSYHLSTMLFQQFRLILNQPCEQLLKLLHRNPFIRLCVTRICIAWWLLLWACQNIVAVELGSKSSNSIVKFNSKLIGLSFLSVHLGQNDACQLHLNQVTVLEY